VAHLKSVRPADQAEIIAERNRLSDTPGWAARGESVHLGVSWGGCVSATAQAGGAESRHERGTDVRNSQRCAPVLVERGNEHVVPRSKKTHPHFIEGCGAEEVRCAERDVLCGVGSEIARGRIESFDLYVGGPLQPVIVIVSIAAVDLEIL